VMVKQVLSPVPSSMIPPKDLPWGIVTLVVL